MNCGDVLSSGTTCTKIGNDDDDDDKAVSFSLLFQTVVQQQKSCNNILPTTTTSTIALSRGEVNVLRIYDAKHVHRVQVLKQCRLDIWRQMNMESCEDKHACARSLAESAWRLYQLIVGNKRYSWLGDVIHAVSKPRAFHKFALDHVSN